MKIAFRSMAWFRPEAAHRKRESYSLLCCVFSTYAPCVHIDHQLGWRLWGRKAMLLAWVFFFSRFKIRQSAAYTILLTIKQIYSWWVLLHWVIFVYRVLKMLLNSTLDILEISENKRLLYFFKILGEALVLPHLQDTGGLSLLPSSFVPFLSPPLAITAKKPL